MTELNVFLEIVRYLHYIIDSDYYCRRSTVRQQDFSRKRKMSFTDYIYAIIRGSKSGLQAGLNAFFSAYKDEELVYSKQAFSQGRQRILPEAFLELFQATVFKFYEKANLSTWKGYHLFGIDGSKMNLPCTKELEEAYGIQITKGAAQVQALVSCVYDLLNGIIVDVRFEPCAASERDAAKSMIRNFSVKQVKNPVFIMDRGYPSAELMDAIMSAGHTFVMRCSTEFIQKMKLSDNDNIIHHKFAKMKSPMKLRMVKVQLSDNTVEYLATNLYDADITTDDFKWLYHQRWGIETKYNDIKSKLYIEDFSGYSKIAVEQDFYATLLLANLAGALQFELHDEIEALHSTPENLYEYRLNVSRTIAELKLNVIEMLMATSTLKRHRLLLQIAKRLQNDVTPVRPGRSAPRHKKHRGAKYSQNSKHIG